MCESVWVKRFSCHAGYQELAGVVSEVNLRNPFHASDKTQKRRIHPGFEIQDRRHQKSDRDITGPIKDLCPLLFFFKESYLSQCKL